METDTAPRPAVDMILYADLFDAHAADIVAHLNELDVEEASALLTALPAPRAIEVFDQSELTRAGEILLLLPEKRAGGILVGIADDRAADILRQLDSDERAELLRRLDFEHAWPLKRLLAYRETTAGGLMSTEFVSVPTTYTVAQTLAHLREVERTRETIYTICVLDPETRVLEHVVTLRKLIVGAPEQPILDLVPDRKPVTVEAETDQEEVARLISIHDLLAVPVVNERGQVLGIVTVDDVIDAIVAESTEDVQRFGGVEGMSEPYLSTSFLEMYRKRAGWLCALFLGEMLTASAMQHYEDALQKAVVLTLFIPLIMSSGGNSGSQATSLLIRAIALGHIRLGDWWRVALREAPIGLTLGLTLGAIGLVRIAIWQKFGVFDYGPHWLLIGLTVGAGLIGIVTFGSLAGSMLPFILRRLGFDPASASAPFVATLVDVTGLMIYFSIASVMLRGVLL